MQDITRFTDCQQLLGMLSYKTYRNYDNGGEGYMITEHNNFAMFMMKTKPKAFILIFMDYKTWSSFGGKWEAELDELNTQPIAKLLTR